MECASDFAYMKRKKAMPIAKPMVSKELISKSNNLEVERGVHLEEDDDVDTNVISLDFKALQTAMQNLSFGDPNFCTTCKASLTSLSLNNIHNKDKYQQLYSASKKSLDVIPEENNAKKVEEEKDQQNETKPKPAFLNASDLKSHESVWICEFCGTHNKISIESEELPKSNDLFYMLQSAIQTQSTDTPNSSDQDISVIFCIDFSGSMCVTSEIKVKEQLKHGLSAEEYEMLKAFIEPGASQNLPKQKQGTQWISRKQCVLAAIETQLTEMKKSHPKRKVGVVAFNNDVILYGDGSADPVVIAGDKLGKKDVCLSIGAESSASHMSRAISESEKKLIDKLYSIKESGKTALGPAIAISLGLASKGKPGSTVVICTDGLANVGIGDLDTPKSKTDNFYEDMGIYAKERGIMVNIITIKGEGCKMEKLGQLADLTQGKVTRVNPDSITSDFASIMKDEVVGTQVEVKIRLHPALKFRNEEAEYLTENKSVYLKNIGNVTAGTTLTFEYQTKNDVELQQEGIDLNDVKEVPLQATITYISSQGNKILRIITKKQLTTEDITQAEKNVKVKVLATRATQKTSAMAGKGNHMKAQALNSKWDDYISNDIAVSNAGDETYSKNIGVWKSKNSVVQEHLTKRAKRRDKVEDSAESKPGFMKGMVSGIKSVLGISQKDSKEMPKEKEVLKKEAPKKSSLPAIEKKSAPIMATSKTTSSKSNAVPISKASTGMAVSKSKPMPKSNVQPTYALSKNSVPVEEEGSSDEEDAKFYQLKQAKLDDFE